MLPIVLDPRFSIRARLLWGVGLLALVTTLLATRLVGGAATEAVREDRGSLMAELSQAMMQQMERGIFERLREIWILSTLKTLRDPQAPLAEKRALLDRLKSTYRHYAWLGLTDGDGTIVAGTDDLLVGKSVATRDWFVEGSKGPHVGDVHDAFLLAKMLPRPEHDFLPLRLLDVSAPIFGEDGRLLGVVCGHLSWDWSYEVRNALLDPIREQNAAEVVIVNREGRILLSTPDLHRMTERLDLQSLAAARRGGSGHLTEHWPDGTAYLTGYAPSRGFESFRGLGWTVLVRQEVRQAFAKAASLEQYTRWVGVAFTVLFALLLWVLAGRITGPTVAIAQAADRIRRGETDAQIPLFAGRDEAASLSVALDNLVRTMQGANRQLAEAAQVFESSTEGIIVTDAEQRILSVNRAFCAITGHAAAEVLGQTPRLLSSGRHDDAFYRQMWQTLTATGAWQGEIWNRRKNGEVYPEWLIITTVRDSGGRVDRYVGIFTDITERKRAEERILHLAEHDGLTELPNRLVYFEQLNQALRRACQETTRVAVLFIDLDRFKNVNDSLGHHVGDRLLTAVARRLGDAAAEAEMVARLGGDEFVMILPHLTGPEQAGELALRIADAIKLPYSIEGYDLNISASIGVSLFPEDGIDAATLTRHADMAMFHAKERRSDFAFFTPELDGRVRERLALESGLRGALTQQQFHLLYQPQYDLRSGRMVGVEALLRWHHPELGLVPPDKFIPVAEEIGLINAIGEWVLLTACREAARWQEGTHPLRLAVNLSTHQFGDPHLAEKVEAILEECGLEPAQLELEVTESMLMESAVEAGATIAHLNACGVRFAIDDFGTGYSNLGYLKHLSMDALKIDRSFTMDLFLHEDAPAIVETIIGMAHSLRLAVIAEGIEGDRELKFLRERGCDMGQGYHLARPMPAAGVDKLLELDDLIAS